MKNVVLFLLLSVVSFLTYGQESKTLDDWAKVYFGADASYLPSEYLPKLTVYDKAEFNVTYDLAQDEDGLVLHKDNFSYEGESGLDAYLGLLAGVKIESGDVLAINNISSIVCCRSDLIYCHIFDSEFKELTKSNGLRVSFINGNTQTGGYIVGFARSGTYYFPVCGGAFNSDGCLVRIEEDKNVNLSIKRFRAIAKFELTMPENLNRNTLLNVKVKAYDANGEEVPVLNVSENQWDYNVTTRRATFTPVYDYSCLVSSLSRGGYLCATGVAFYIDTLTSNWDYIYDSETADRNVVASNLHVSSAGGSLSVSGTDGKPYQVYALSGQKAYDGTDAKVPLPTGIYVVKFNGEAVKAVVK